MNKKQIFIGLGILAVAVVIIYKKKKEKKSSATNGDGEFRTGDYEKAWDEEKAEISGINCTLSGGRPIGVNPVDCVYPKK